MTTPAKVLMAALLWPMLGMATPAKENWENLCVRCHGPTGDGHTKTGAERRIKDYTDPKVQAEFTDAALLKNLMLGIRSEDGKERMPAFKDKLTVVEAKDLVALIRNFKK